jgi:hypothetical protein
VTLGVDPILYLELADGDVLRNMTRLTIVGKEDSAWTSPAEQVLRDEPLVQELPGEFAWALTIFLMREEAQLAVKEVDPVVADRLSRGVPWERMTVAATTLRTELREAQQKHPPFREVIGVIEAKKMKEVAADRTAYDRAKSRAQAFVLAPDGVLLRVGLPGNPDGTPVMPPIPIGDRAAKAMEASPSRTWREIFLMMAHEPVPSVHQPDADRMMASLHGVAYWDAETGASGLRAACVKWADACRICGSRNRTGRVGAPMRSLDGLRPFAVLTWDLVFVTPRGRQGQVGCLSAIDRYTRYLWLRWIFGKDAKSVAWALLALVADAGVFPSRLLSDRERSFRTLGSWSSRACATRGRPSAWPTLRAGTGRSSGRIGNSTEGSDLQFTASPRCRTRIGRWRPAWWRWWPGSGC